MNTFKTLIWLRWRLLRNDTSSKLPLAVIVVFVFLACFGIGFSIGFVLNRPFLPFLQDQANWIRMVNRLLVFYVLFVLFMNTVSSGRIIRQVNQSSLDLYPMSDLSRLSAHLLLSLIDVWYIGFMGLLLGFASGLKALFLSPHSFVDLLVLFGLITLGLHFFIECFRALRRSFPMFPAVVRWLLSVLVVSVALYAIYLISQRVITENAMMHTPIGWLSMAFHSLRFLHSDSFVLIVVGRLGLVVVAEFILLLLLQAACRYLSHDKTRPASNEPGTRRLDLERVSPDTLTLYLKKECLLLHRSGRIRVSLLISSLWVALSIFLLVVTDLELKSNNFFLLTNTLLIPLLMWEQHLNNCFGRDSSAFALYLTTPISIHKVYVAKNLSAAFGILPSLVPSWLFWCYFLGPGTLPFLLLTQASVMCFMTTLGNINSVLSPFATLWNSKLQSSTPMTASWIGLASAVGSFSLIVMTVFINQLFGFGPNALTLVLFLAVLAGIFYSYVVKRCATLWEKKSEWMHLQLKRS